MGGIDVVLAHPGPSRPGTSWCASSVRCRWALLRVAAVLGTQGMPSKPEDLARHDVLTYSLWDASPRLPFLIDGKTHYVPVRSHGRGRCRTRWSPWR